MALLLIFCISEFEKYEENNMRIEHSKWREDFAYIVSQIEEFHPRAFHNITKEDLQNELETLVVETYELTDYDVAFELNRIIAMLGDGHTYVSYKYIYSEDWYPVLFVIIDGKAYIRDAYKEYDDVLYKEVIEFNGHDASDVISKLSEYISGENEYIVESYVESRLSNPMILRYLDIVSEKGKLELTINDDDKISRRSVEKVPYSEVYTYFDEKRFIGNRSGVNNYSYEYFPDADTMMFYYNVCFEDDELPMETFNDEFWDQVRDKKVDKIIVNLSGNAGGYPEVINPFFKKLYKSDFNKKEKLFVLIGNRNYSAGTMAASRFKTTTEAILIGEPTGGTPVMCFDTVECITPNKGIELYVATDTFVAHYDVSHNTIMPDVYIQKTIEDYRNNINPFLEYVQTR